MPTSDFNKYAVPWLDQLQDDPDQPKPSKPDSTTFPGAGSDLTGVLRRFDDGDTPESEFPFTSVDEADADAARSARSMAGLDVLAFYKSYRFIERAPFPGQWGIFLLDAGIEGLARDLMEYQPTLPLPEAWHFAREILLAHERYHFWIDAWALGQEIMPLGAKLKRYEYYHSAKKSVELTPDDVEESLANHYAYNKLRRWVFSGGTPAAPVLRKLLLDGPLPYSDCFFGTVERAQKEGWLALAVANGKEPLFFRNAAPLLWNSCCSPTVLSASIQPVDRRHPIAGTSGCPTYFVRTSRYAALVQPFQGPPLKEFRKFMMNYLDGQKLETTDHDYYRIDNGEKVKAPNPHDKEIRGYELKNTLCKAGMTQKEFVDAREETSRWSKKCPRDPVKQPFTNT